MKVTELLTETLVEAGKVIKMAMEVKQKMDTQKSEYWL